MQAKLGKKKKGAAKKGQESGRVKEKLDVRDS